MQHIIEQMQQLEKFGIVHNEKKAMFFEDLWLKSINNTIKSYCIEEEAGVCTGFILDDDDKVISSKGISRRDIIIFRNDISLIDNLLGTKPTGFIPKRFVRAVIQLKYTKIFERSHFRTCLPEAETMKFTTATGAPPKYIILTRKLPINNALIEKWLIATNIHALCELEDEQRCFYLKKRDPSKMFLTIVEGIIKDIHVEHIR